MTRSVTYAILESTDSSGWKYKYYDIFQSSIGDVTPRSIISLINYCDSNLHRENFRTSIEINGIQYLAGVFLDLKEIRLATKHLSTELFLLSLDPELTEDFKEVREYSESIATIPVENSPFPIEFISSSYDLPLFKENDFSDVHDSVINLSEELSSKISNYNQSFFEKISDFGLDLTASFMLIRIHLLKFLAILPNLDHDKSGKEVKRVFNETLKRLIRDSNLASEKSLKGQKRPLPNGYINIFKITLYLAKYIPANLFAKAVRFTVSKLAKRFIAGESINKAKHSLEGILKSGRDATIDQLGELVVSNKEADDYTERVVETILGLKQYIPKGSKNSAGIYKAHVSIKVSALCNDFKPQDLEYTYNNVAPRLKKILKIGMEQEVFVNIDAEHYHYRDIIFRIYSKVLLSNDCFKEYSQTGIVVQAYLRDGIKHLLEVLDLAKARGLSMPIRLVKGAYWDAETIEADAHNFNAPQFLNKEETDIHFRQLVYKILDSAENLQLTVASHNIQDHCFARVLREKRFSSALEIEHQCLHMTYEALSVGLSQMGWATRNYIPVGDLLVGMAYLVRRIMENSSQVGVLTIMRSHKKALNSNSPTQKLNVKKSNIRVKYDKSVKVISREFKNVYPLRTYLKEHFDIFNSKLVELKDSLSKNLIDDSGDIEIHSSSDPSLILGKVSYDTKKIVDDKCEVLFNGYKNFIKSDDNKKKRLVTLTKLSDLLLVERERLAALIMLEAGKTIDESLADVDEAIDFINFYTREQLSLIESKNLNSRGVIGVIAPWNFPLAIPCGMTVAGLVAGNSVILKPAEQTPLIAKKFVDLCYKAGIKYDELQISLGAAEVGQSIVNNELIVGVVFTGSKAVGERIFNSLSSQVTSTRYSYKPLPKFAITEMGGKNAIIVTNNSELDETVSGVIYSAFAHSGQKCSAASRIIIDEQIKDAFIARFANAVKDIKVGRADDFSTVINPLISLEDQERVKKMAKEARDEVVKIGGRIIVDESNNEYPGYCVGPSVFEINKSIALDKDSVANREVFGPVIHIIPYKTIDEAVEIFNSTDYALTGGIYCQSQDDVDYLTPKLFAGNIYINRPNTGARVAIEPFGGFKMSGTGPKAGGVDYIFKFNRQSDEFYSDHEMIFDVNEDRTDHTVRDSQLSEDRRIFNSKKVIRQLINQFEFFFSTIDEENKLELELFLDAISAEDFKLSEREFPNRYIPGQISYSKRDISIGKGFLIDSSKTLTVYAVKDFIINLLIGNGITVITTNETIYEKWSYIIELTHNCGFSMFNVSVSNHKLDTLITVLKSNHYNYILSTSIQLKQEIKEAALESNQTDCLVKIFFLDEKSTIDELLVKYSHCRSFAINTMRLGAPLELTL